VLQRGVRRERGLHLGKPECLGFDGGKDIEKPHMAAKRGLSGVQKAHRRDCDCSQTGWF
jgi:hypothetical protein